MRYEMTTHYIVGGMVVIMLYYKVMIQVIDIIPLLLKIQFGKEKILQTVLYLKYKRVIMVDKY